MTLCVIDGKQCDCQPDEGYWCKPAHDLKDELAEVKKERDAVNRALGEEVRQTVNLTTLLKESNARAEKAEAALAEIKRICADCVNREGHVVTLIGNIEFVIRGAKE